MLKFLLGNAKTLNASVPIGVASDNLTTFSPVRSPRNRHGAAKTKKKERVIYLVGWIFSILEKEEIRLALSQNYQKTRGHIYFWIYYTHTN